MVAISVPSILNCTLATATLSEAVEVRVTEEPETVAPVDGAVRDTDGGVVSGVGEEPPPPPPPVLLLLPPPKIIWPGV